MTTPDDPDRWAWTRQPDDMPPPPPPALTPVADPEAPPDAFAALVDVGRTTIGYDAAKDDAAADEITAARAQRWTARAIGTAALFLLIFNAPSIVTWSTTLPPNWATATIRDLAGVWDARMTEAGIIAPRTAVHDRYEALKAGR
jgi:hypothetical protein